MQKKSTANESPLIIPDCSGSLRRLKMAGVVLAIMKVTLIQMTVAIIFSGVSIAFDNHAQEILKRRVSMETQNISIAQVLTEIERATKVKFVYSPTRIDLNEKVSLEVSKQRLGTLLSELLTPRAIKFKAQEGGDYIILVEGGNIDFPMLQFGDSLEHEVNIANISGTVTDGAGGPMPGVNIIEKGTTNGTTTSADGRYSLEVLGDDAILIFSFIGYTTQEVAVSGRSVIDVALIEDVHSLNEVVVVGYGTQKKVNVIGSVTTIGSKELAVAPVSTISNALAGRLPGVIVQQRSGEPGKDQASILIRGTATLGNNAPLIVIDGIPGRDLNTIAAGNIESISVLKDASAAIYGSRAANGVILVTTKGGLKNSPATFNYEFYEGFLSPTMVPEMADAPTYAQMVREMQSYRNVDEANMSFSLEDIEKFRSGNFPWTHPNTDWFDAGLADYSRSRNHNFSVSGGEESVNYHGAFGTQYDGGIYTNSVSSFNRYNLAANVDVAVNELLDVGIDINASQENRMFPTRGAGTVFDHLIRSYPTETAVFPNGLPGPDVERGDQPLVISSFQPGYDDDKRYRIYNTLSASFKIPGVSGLSLSSYYAYDIYFKQRKLFERPFMLYQLDKGAYLAAGNTGSEDGSAFLSGIMSGQAPEPRLNDYFDNTKTNTFNLRLNYDKTVKEVHNISTFVSYESSEHVGQGIEAFRRYFVSDKLPYLFAGGDAEKNNGGWIDLDARVNYFGRFSYNYKETYLFQFSFRRDGSLRFSEENGRWGNFPGLLAGWNVSNERFWKQNFGFIDFLKVKASWGKMGNDLVDPFQYLATYEFDTGTVFGTGRNYATGLDLSGTPNAFITWEVANVFNAGFESNFLNGKLSLDADFFYERRNNILVERSASVPSYTGISLPDENFGIVDNKGFEIVFGYSDKKSDFSYGINGNFAFVRNRVVEFDEPERNVPWQVQTGFPQGSALLYRSIGIFRDEEHVNSLPHVPGARPGDIIIEDYDGNGKINNDDRTLFSRTTNPEITYGVSFNVGYQNWGLSGLVQGAGRSMRLMYSSLQGSAGNYYQYDADGRWTPDNIYADKPRAFEREEEYWRLNYRTDYSYHNTSYARLKNLQLSYRIPSNLVDIIKASNARLYLSGQNLFLIHSGTEIMDPELGSMNSYPIMKVYSFGANITF